jgi:DNA end-binding protein Ku
MAAQWKGHLRLSLVTCPVRLHNATSEAGKISFNILNKHTGNRIKLKQHDAETDEVGERADQIKGYQHEKNRYITITDEDLDAIQVESARVIDIERFVDRAEIDQIYWDSPYYLEPDGPMATEAFAVIREAMRREDVVGLGRVVISSRERAVAIEPRDKGMLVTTLRDAREVKPASAIFEGIPEAEVNEDMLSLAETIIARKRGPFDPALFEDRYQTALRNLVEAKVRGEKPAAASIAEPKVIDLMAALKRSLEQAGGEAKPPARSRRRAEVEQAAPAAKQTKRRKAG